MREVKTAMWSHHPTMPRELSRRTIIATETEMVLASDSVLL
jgi:hypothetical protein